VIGIGAGSDTCIHTHVHTYIHSYTHTHTYIQIQQRTLNSEVYRPLSPLCAVATRSVSVLQFYVLHVESSFIFVFIAISIFNFL
jgi:hypothetical protein